MPKAVAANPAIPSTKLARSKCKFSRSSRDAEGRSNSKGSSRGRSNNSRSSTTSNRSRPGSGSQVPGLGEVQGRVQGDQVKDAKICESSAPVTGMPAKEKHQSFEKKNSVKGKPDQESKKANDYWELSNDGLANFTPHRFRDEKWPSKKCVWSNQNQPG